MSHEDYITGQFQSWSPINQSENEADKYEPEVDDYIAVQIGSTVYKGFVTEVVGENFVFGLEDDENDNRWCTVEQIVSVNGQLL